MSSSIPRRLIAVALLAVVFAAMLAAGSRVGAPSWSSGSARLGAMDPLMEAAAVLRLVAMAVCVWLALVTLLDVVAQAARANPVGKLAAALAPAAWRNLVLRPVAVATLAAPQVLVPTAAVTPIAAQVPADIDIDQEAGAARSGATLEMVPYAPPTRTITMALHEPDAVDPPPPAPTSISAAARVKVGAGENLWSIAAAHLSDQLGRRPSPAEVTPYWHAVIEANRHTLPDPENPDLLYRGIELTMPPVAG